MTNLYNTLAYQQDPNRPAASQWTSNSASPRMIGGLYNQDIVVAITAANALSNVAPDRIYLMDTTGSIFTGAGLVALKRLYIANTVNVGGTTTFNLGWLNGGQTLYGSALTTLQSATVVDVAIALLEAATVPTVQDSLVMTIASAGPSTTASALSGFIQFSIVRS